MILHVVISVALLFSYLAAVVGTSETLCKSWAMPVQAMIVFSAFWPIWWTLVGGFMAWEYIKEVGRRPY
jgi:hypothetical protein